MLDLGRLIPPDFEHVSKYPIAATPGGPPTHVPVAPGVNWYTAFDTPTQAPDGTWWVARHGGIGTVRGGHCFCLEPALDPTLPGREQDTTTWWQFYNQGEEGSCEGHGHSRMQSILLRKRFDAVWLYQQAQKIDGIKGQHEGTTNRAVLEVLRTVGHRVVTGGTVSTAVTRELPPNLADGISAYRWATSADEVLAALGTPTLDYVTILNSWGEQYPHRVRMPANVLDRLLHEQGEAGVVTER